MPDTTIRIDSAPIRMSVSSAPVRLDLFAAQGPAGPAGPNVVNASTTSDGTATLSLSSVTAATAEVTGTLTANHIHGNLAGSVYAHVRAGEALAKGDPVYVSGFHPGTSTAIVSKADAGDAAKMPAVGVMDAAVAHNINGHMVITGVITDVNTGSYAVNAELYVATGGGLTATPPTVRAQPVARVERSNTNNGAVLVKVNGLSASDPTPSTLVRRDASGAAEFVGLTVTGGTTFGGESLVSFYAVEYDYGAGAAAAHRAALGSGGVGDPLFLANNIAQLDAAMGITTVKKTSDQTLIVTSLTSVISFPVVANVKYRIWGELILQSTITSVGFASELWFPVPDTVLGSSVMGWMMQTNGAMTGIQLLTTTRSNWLGAYSGAAAVRRLPFDLTTRFTTSGTVSIAAAQRTPDAANPSYCKAGTYMKYQIIDA